MDRFDLHSHTTASDGLHEPWENVKMAKEAGLEGLAITDHDTVDGVPEAEEAARQWGIQLVPGVEISTLYENQDVHILGYYMDIFDPVFLEALKQLRSVRDRRNRMIVEKLQDLGILLSIEEVYIRKKPGQNVGRPHIAEVLVDKGVVSSVQEAFDVYLGEGGKAYVTLSRMAPFEASELIHAAGGVSVLAHPGLYGQDELVQALIEAGIDGIECFHPDHCNEQEKEYARLVEDAKLIATAGSDFHGKRGDEVFHAPIGAKTVDISVVTSLKARASARSS